MGRDRELLTLKYLDRFFHETNKGIIEQEILPIIEERSYISLRFIENYVTKYCREHPTFIKKGNTYIDIYNDYKNQLTSFDKKSFDIFKRRHSSTASSDSNKSIDDECHLIAYPCNELGKKMFITSIGQLNFFRWLIKNNILFHIKNNYPAIKVKMQKSRGKGKFIRKINTTQNAASAAKSLKIEVI